MPLYEYEEILRRAAQNNVKIIFISGGEPLLHRDIELFISKTKEYKIDPFLYSSGSTISNNEVVAIQKDYFESLHQKGLTGVAFSLYSLKSLHNIITRTKKSFEILEQTLKNIKDINGLSREFNFIPLRDNRNEIENIIDFAMKYNIKKINILKLISQGRAKRNLPQLSPMSIEEEKSFFKLVKDKSAQTEIVIEVSKLYDCDHYDSSLVSDYKKNENEKFITVYNNEIPGRRFRDVAR